MAPDYGAAHARLAALCGERIIMLASPDARSDQQRALASAKRAIELSGHDPYTLMNAAQGLALCGESERANRMLTRALKALPHDLLCWLFYWSSRATSAPDSELPELIDALNRAVDTYSAHPLAVAFRGTAGICHLKLGHFAKAKSILQECVDDAPGFSFWGVALASVHALEGNAGLSRRVLGDLASQRFRADREYLRAAGEVSVIKQFTDVLAPICS
jgi:predicted Zn-dependent protease